MRKLNEAGIPCGVLMAPIIPFISDDDETMERTISAIAESGATHVTPIVLHLRPGRKPGGEKGAAYDRRPPEHPAYFIFHDRL